MPMVPRNRGPAVRRRPASTPAAARHRATTQSMLAIIGGSGLTRLSTLAVAHREVVRTPYGEPSSALLFGQIGGRDAVFLARHGHGHTIPPHRVNYRANLWALKERGASAVLAVASVGGIRGAAPGRPRAAAPADRLHARPRGDVLRRRRPARGPRRFHPSVHAGAARELPRRGAGGGHRADDGGVYGAVRVRGSRRRPRSTAWSATARRWSA